MIAALVVVLAGAAVWGVPWLVRARDMPASVPSPRALFMVDLVPLQPGQSACSENVAVEPHAQEARLAARTFRRPGQPLAITLQGAGYTARGRVAGGYRDASTVRARIAPPSRSTLVRACVRNAGTARVALMASRDRTRSRSLTSVDGRPTGASVWLAFYERRPESMLDRAGLTIDRMTMFRPGVVGPWLLWPLAVLVLLGIPAAVVWGWGRALRDDGAAMSTSDRSAQR